jgi:mevalonate kinase
LTDNQDPRLEKALASLLPAEGLAVEIETTLPIGRGMGSSAALAVALVRALAAREGRTASTEECIERGFVLERVLHGTPSGVDHTVSTLGGIVRFQLRDGQPRIEALPVPSLPLVVMDSGHSGSTATQVAKVRSQRPRIDGELERIGNLVRQVETLLTRESTLDEIGALLTENHHRLRAIGVSTDRLDQLVRLALDHGALGAKLSGAGGGGVVMALCPEPRELLAVAHRAGIEAFTTQVHPAAP